MRTLGQICLDLQERHALSQSWRVAGDAYGLNPAMARMIAYGYSPGKKIRGLLGLPAESSVVVMAGEVPAGSQAVAALQCECGQWFIANHPRRRRCFVCSPYKGRRVTS